MNLLPVHAITPNTIHHMDLFALCNALADESVDMILCDPPYGTTACSWDSVIPIDRMWTAFKRIIKPCGAIVLTASEPFTSRLVSSNYEMFRHEWIWHKSIATGHLNVNFAPLKAHESVLTFSRMRVNFYPQKIKGDAYVKTSGSAGGYMGDRPLGGYVTINSGWRYPRSVIDFNSCSGLHPTQKPIALFEYLIKTYTQPGDLVFDPCVGSGTTAVAARKTGRHYICGDINQEYVDITRKRLQDTDPYQPTVDDKTGMTQLSLFQEDS